MRHKDEYPGKPYIARPRTGIMSVILEFTIDSEDFQIGEALSGTPNMHLELERIVPTGDMMMPFVWATGANHDAFRENVKAHPAIKTLLVLDCVGESTLYRVVWEVDPIDLIEGIVEASAVILEARGNKEWTFRLRFPDHDKLSYFHNFILEQKLSIHIDRTYTLTETTERGHRFNLSQEQREALVLAAKQGYFATPRETSLDSLADQLGISEQAVSNRVRRGNEKILREVLLSSAIGVG